MSVGPLCVQEEVVVLQLGRPGLCYTAWEEVASESELWCLQSGRLHRGSVSSKKLPRARWLKLFSPMGCTPHVKFPAAVGVVSQ